VTYQVTVVGQEQISGAGGPSRRGARRLRGPFGSVSVRLGRHRCASRGAGGNVTRTRYGDLHDPDARAWLG